MKNLITAFLVVYTLLFCTAQTPLLTGSGSDVSNKVEYIKDKKALYSRIGGDTTLIYLESKQLLNYVKEHDFCFERKAQIESLKSYHPYSSDIKLRESRQKIKALEQCPCILILL